MKGKIYDFGSFSSSVLTELVPEVWQSARTFVISKDDLAGRGRETTPAASQHLTTDFLATAFVECSGTEHRNLCRFSELSAL